MSRYRLMSTVTDILRAKRQYDGYLWLQAAAGDVILWRSEEDAEGDNGSRAIARWALSREEEDALIATGEVDELN